MYHSIFLLSLMLLSTTATIAAPGGPPATPIDGGLGLLLAAGAAYGIKKVKDHRKHKRS